MNLVVMDLTLSGLLGRRRSLLLVALPVVLLGLAALTRWASDASTGATSSLLGNFAMGTVLPLTCLLVGTGVIAPEIDDGSIVYLLAKPVPRSRILLSKLAVALSATVVFAVLPIMAAAAIAGDEQLRLAQAYGLAALLAGICYTSLFVALSVLTRNAVIVGLLYALLWEAVIGGYVPGVRDVSVRQWALAPAEALLGDRAASWGVTSAVNVPVGLTLLAVVTVGAAWLGIRKLGGLRLTTAD
jgi:ABC-2 type transport system permease protein